MISATDKKEKMIKALESTESFFALLDNERGEEKYNRLQQSAKTETHPSGTMLYDLFNGTLDDNMADNIHNHLFLCRRCSDEFARIMRIENELDAEAMEWIDNGDFSKWMKNILEALSDITPGETAVLTPVFEQEEEEEEEEYDMNLFRVKSKIPAAGRIDGGYVILPDDDSEDIEELRKAVSNTLKAGTSPSDYRIHVLARDENEKWHVCKQADSLEIPVKVEHSNIPGNEFILVIDLKDCVSISSETVIRLLNSGKSKKQLFSTTVVVAVEIPDRMQ